MTQFNFGIIGDPGNYRSNGTRFYYNPAGGYKGANKNISAIGPGQAAVGDLVQSFQNTDLINLGDLTYTPGASTLIDASNGLFYNNFMAPYPSPSFIEKPYQQNIGDVVWPYDTYDYPKGFPNPVTGGVGGSADGVNRFWPTIGNHDYGLRIGYSDANVAYGPGNTAIPAGPTSTPVPQPSVDYFGWLADPALLTNQNNVKVQKADGSGQSGIYYSVELGAQANGDPLIEVFSLDAQRLMMNAGYYNLSDGFGSNNLQTGTPNYAYDPTKPYVAGTSTAAVLTNDPANGQAQFAWLEESMANSKAKWKIIMGHQPIYSSGQWGKSQPDDHMSNPLLQKVLDALPTGSFDAYLNGHSHYYQRVLEGNTQGIGQGIPFITNGNSGRGLYAINQTLYGDNVYTPSTPGLSLATYNGVGSASGDISPYLLQSAPTTVGVSGGWFTTDAVDNNYKGNKTGFTAGAYGYGFGAQDAQANDGYLFFNYKQTDVLDPAIIENLEPTTRNTLLSGWDGLTQADWKPALTKGMTSAQVLDATAQVNITVATDGTISAVAVKTAGKGYMASKGGNQVVDFEIRGNDSFTAGAANPNNYAIATLTFTSGKLTYAVLKSAGSGYSYLGQANLATGFGDTVVFSTPQINAIPINASLLESWYTVPFVDYQDWYMITDTKSSATGKTGGNFGTLQIALDPLSAEAISLIASTPITTGYSGSGQQQKFSRPQQGTVSVKDSNGNTVGTGSVNNGIASVTLTSRPAPGPVNLNFDGDSVSSYLINFKSSNTPTVLNYGNWSGPASAASTISFTLAQNLNLTVTRADSLDAKISFGLTNGSASLALLNDSTAAAAGFLTIDSIYSSTAWKASEGKAFGSAAVTPVAAGTWTPTATKNGNALTLTSTEVSGNNVTATFFDPITGIGGIKGSFTLAGTGVAFNPGTVTPVVTVQQLGVNNNAIAFYEADSITGAVAGIAPGANGYLQAALANSKANNLLFSASQLPGYQQSSILANANINPAKNYGLLLLANGSESNLYSSYSAANPGGLGQFQSFGVTNRGLAIGIEDLAPSDPNYDGDFNDIILTVASSTVAVI
jgi:hypothetical protein